MLRLVLQTLVRMLLAKRRKWRLRRQRAASRVRASFLRHKFNKRFKAMKRAAVRAQSFTRGILVRVPMKRAAMKQKNDAATKIQVVQLFAC